MQLEAFILATRPEYEKFMAEGNYQPWQYLLLSESPEQAAIQLRGHHHPTVLALQRNYEKLPAYAAVVKYGFEVTEQKG